MNKTITIDHNITASSRQLLGAAQICEISSEILKSSSGTPVPVPSPGAPVVCRLSNGRQYVCRWFGPPGGRYLAERVCFVDETVELLEDGKWEDTDDIPRVKELTMVEDNLCYFEKVKLDLSIDCLRLNLDLVRNLKDLTEFVKDLLRPLYFCRGCLVKTEDRDESNCGVVTITIQSTNGTERFGHVDCRTVVQITNISFSTIQSKKLGGLSTAKEALLKSLKRSDDVENVLLAGPPGSGKYSLIAEVAREGNYPVFEIRGLDFLKSYPGETELELRKIFERMGQFNELFEREGRTILLVKDVDTLCPKLSNRKGEDLSNISRISSQFTALLDRYHNAESGIIVIGTTSNIENLDTRVRRPGRLGTEIFIRMPSEQQRGEIMNAVLQRTNFVLNETILDEIIRRTPGYVGTDLELLVHALQRALSKHADQNVMTTVDECLKKIRPVSLRNSIGLISGLNQTLDTIGGMDQLKKTLRVSILGPLQHPQAFRRFGMNPLKGILLYGPPGCAKTTIAKCIAAESRMTFVSVSAAEVYSPYVGDSEKLISRLFNQARQSAPAVIFLDEIDSLVGKRGMQGVQHNDVHIRVLSTLLTEMDGIGFSVQSSIGTSDDSKNILVIAATNRPDMIDDALLRPGRLTKLIHVPAPDETARYEILKKVSESVPLAEDVDLREMARQTERYSGADLQNLCSQSALHAAALDENVQRVSMVHFQHVLREGRPSLTSKQIQWYTEYETMHKIVG